MCRTLVLWLALLLCGAVVAEDELPLVEAQTQTGEPGAPAPLQQGLATWYGGKRWHGRRTASGERFDRHALTAAHPSLPLGTLVKVVNTLNGREVLVRINDRGPRGRRFIIDLSESAAEQLGFKRRGWTPVALHDSAVDHMAATIRTSP